MRPLRALFLTLFFVLLASAASATQITVTQHTIAGWQNTNTAPRLRIFLNKPVVTSDSRVLQSGSTQSGVFYQSITCSVSAGVLTIPEFTIDSLPDALVGSDAKYSAYFYTATGQQITAFGGFTAFSVPAKPASTSWAAILMYNATTTPHIDNLTYNRTQIDAKIAAVSEGNTSAPATAPFVLKTPSAGLVNAQALSALATGLVKNTTGTGSLSIATAGTDYESPMTFGAPLARSVNAVSIPAATGAQNGYLTSADWATFNAKQAAGNYVTALTGDVTASGPGSVAATIANDAVTFAKLQNVTTQSLLGRSTAGTGDVEVLTIGSGLQLLAGVLSATGGGGSGTVTTFSAGDLSPLFTTSEANPTTTPALTFSLSNAAAHSFFGNNSGATAAPAFVALGTADIPDLSGTYVDKTSGQTVAGAKTFTAPGVFSTSLDAIVKNSTAANLPAVGNAGRLYFQTDGTRGLIVDQGSAWYFPDQREINVQEFGAKVDGRLFADASMSSTVNTTTLASASAAFTSADVGKLAAVTGAGVGGATLQGSILSITDSSHVVLDTAASTTVPAAAAFVATDDTTAFTNAIAAANRFGQVIRIPAGRMGLSGAGLTFGDGTNTTASSINGIRILGAGGGESQIGFRNAPTEIWWFGNSGAAIFTFNGPMGGGSLEGMLIDCKVGANAAATAIQWNHVHHSRIRDVVIQNHSGFAIKVDTRPVGIVGVNVGSDDNVIEHVWSAAPSSTTGGGLQLGAAATTSYGTSRNQIRDSWFYAGSGATAKAVEERYGDANNFWGVTTSKVGGSGVGITMTAATDNSAYPSATTFYNVAAMGNTAVGGTWAPLDKVHFWPYSVADGETVPADAGFAGVTSRNLFFGAFTFRDVTTFTLAPVFSAMTSGSLLYAGTSGALSQNNANLFWDNSNKRLGIGTASPSFPLTLVTSGGNAGVRMDNGVGNFLTYVGSGTSGWAVFDLTAGLDRLVVDSAGDVNAIVSLSTPLIYGGAAAGSDLTIKGTSHASPSAAHILLNPLAASGATQVGGVLVGAPIASYVGANDVLHVQAPDNSATDVYVDSYGVGVASEILFRRARGSLASPSALLSGDFIASFGAMPYHSGGAFASSSSAAIAFIAAENQTNTARGSAMVFDTTPTGSTTLFERWRIEHGGWLIGQELTANPTTAELAAGNQVAMYVKADKLVFAYNQGGTIKYIVFTLDGSTATFTNSSSAP